MENFQNPRESVGSFGVIYRAKDYLTKENVAIKIEKKYRETHTNNFRVSVLKKESEILVEMQNFVGFPRLFNYDETDDLCIMTMSLLSSNLEILLKKCSNKFTLKTTIMIGYQMFERIEILHKKHFLHRDIKPENFVIGIEDKKTIHLIDFGLSKKYIENNEHIPYKENKGLVGTARYTSLNTHLGIEQSRRDDLEAICYLLVYFYKGGLPWQNLPIASKNDKFKRIMEMKRDTTADMLCRDMPYEFEEIFLYVKSLSFEETPNYFLIREKLLEICQKYNFEIDYDYDWDLLFGNKKKILENIVEFLEDSAKIIKRKSKEKNMFILPRFDEEEVKKKNMIEEKFQMKESKENKDNISNIVHNSSLCEVKDDYQVPINEILPTFQPKLMIQTLKTFEITNDMIETSSMEKTTTTHCNSSNKNIYLSSSCKRNKFEKTIFEEFENENIEYSEDKINSIKPTMTNKNYRLI